MEFKTEEDRIIWGAVIELMKTHTVTKMKIDNSYDYFTPIGFYLVKKEEQNDQSNDKR